MGTVHAEVSAVLSEPVPWRKRESVTSFFEDYEFMKQVIPDPRAVGSPSRRFLQTEIAPEDKALYTEVLLTNPELYNEVYKKTHDHKTLLVTRSKKKKKSGGKKKSEKKKSKHDLREKSQGQTTENAEEGAPEAPGEVYESEEEDAEEEAASPLQKSLEWGDIRAALVTPKSSVPLVKVMVQRASNLKLGFGGPPQPFVLLEIGNRRAFTLTAIHSLLNPSWFEEFTFELRSETEALEFSVIDQNPQCKGVLLGSGTIDVLDMQFRSPKDFELELQPKEGTPERDVPWVGGTLTVTIEVTMDVARRGIESYANVRQFFEERKSKNLERMRDMNAIKELRESELREKELRLSLLMKLSQETGSGNELGVVVPDHDGVGESVNKPPEMEAADVELSTNEKKLVNAFKMVTMNQGGTVEDTNGGPATSTEELINLTEQMLAAVERQGSRFKAAGTLMLERERGLNALSDLINMKQNGLDVEVDPTKVLDTSISPTARIRAMAMMSRMSSNFVKKREENGRPTMYAFLNKDELGGEDFGLNHTPSKKKIHRVAPLSSPKRSPSKSSTTTSPGHERANLDFVSEDGSPLREDNTTTTIGSESKKLKKKRRQSPRRSPYYSNSRSVQVSPVLSVPSLAELSGASLGSQEKKSGSPKRKRGLKRKTKRGLATSLFSPEGNSQTRSLIAETSLDLLFDPTQQYSGISLPADETGHRPNIKGGKLEPIVSKSQKHEPRGVRFTVRGIMKKHGYPPPAPSSLSIADERQPEMRVRKNIVSQSQYMLQTFQEIVRERSAILVQRIWKGYLTRLWYKYVIYQVVKCQSLVRGMQARRRNASFKRSTLLLTKKSFVDEALKALGPEGRVAKPLSRSGSRSGVAAMFGVEEGTVIHGTSTPRTRRKTTSEEREKSSEDHDDNESDCDAENVVSSFVLKNLQAEIPEGNVEDVREADSLGDCDHLVSSPVVETEALEHDHTNDVMPRSDNEPKSLEDDDFANVGGKGMVTSEGPTNLDNSPSSAKEPHTLEDTMNHETSEVLTGQNIGVNEADARKSDSETHDDFAQTATSEVNATGTSLDESPEVDELTLHQQEAEQNIDNNGDAVVVDHPVSQGGDQSSEGVLESGTPAEHSVTPPILAKAEEQAPEADSGEKEDKIENPVHPKIEMPEMSPEIIPIDPPSAEKSGDGADRPARKQSEELLFMDVGTGDCGAAESVGSSDGTGLEEPDTGSKSPLSFIKVNDLTRNTTETDDQEKPDPGAETVSPPLAASPNRSPLTVGSDNMPLAKKKKKNSLEIVPLENRQLDVLESPKRPRRRLRSMRLKSGEFSADDLPNHPISILSPKPQDEAGPEFPKWPPPAMQNDPDDESDARFTLYDLPMGDVMDDIENDSEDGEFVPGETIKYRPFYTDSPDKTFEEEMKQSFGTTEEEGQDVPKEQDEEMDEDQYTELSTVNEEDEDQYLSDFDGDDDIAEMHKAKKGESKGHHRKSSSVSDDEERKHRKSNSRGHRKSHSFDRSGGSSNGRVDEPRVDGPRNSNTDDHDDADENGKVSETHYQFEEEGETMPVASEEKQHGGVEIVETSAEPEPDALQPILESIYSKNVDRPAEDGEEQQDYAVDIAEGNNIGEENPSLGRADISNGSSRGSEKDDNGAVEITPSPETFVPISHRDNEPMESPSSSATAATTTSAQSDEIDDDAVDAIQANSPSDDTSSSDNESSDSSETESRTPPPENGVGVGSRVVENVAAPVISPAAEIPAAGSKSSKSSDDEFEYFSDDFED